LRTAAATRALVRELSAQEQNDPNDATVRLAARLRARDSCEYCLMPTFGLFHVDHIVPPGAWPPEPMNRATATKRSSAQAGPDHLDNFAWSCSFCNIAKAGQLGGYSGRRRYRLFNPRRDRWSDHFTFVHTYVFIVGVSGIGHATERALRFNDSRPNGPVGTRHDAIVLGLYPPPWARAWQATTQR
jgi:hypothetical protein